MKDKIVKKIDKKSPNKKPRDRQVTGLFCGHLAEWTGLEPATPGVTGRYSNQLNYHSRRLDSTYCRVWWVLRGSNPRHSPCKGDALPTELSTQHSPLVYSIFQCFTSAKLRHFGRFDLDGGSGTRITARASSALPYVKSSKPHKGHLTAFFQCSLDRSNRAIQCTPSSSFGNIGSISHLIDQFSLVHLDFPFISWCKRGSPPTY